MKNIFKIVLPAIIVLLSYSCSDTYGTDPLAQLDPKIKPAPMYTPEDLKWIISDYIDDNGTTVHEEWANEKKYKLSFKLDTNNAKTYGYLNVNLTFDYDEEFLDRRDFVVKNLIFRADAFEVRGLNVVWGPEITSAICEVVLLDTRNNQEVIINQTSTNAMRVCISRVGSYYQVEFYVNLPEMEKVNVLYLAGVLNFTLDR